eukprot:1484058-Rhodomonas_salina.1
MLYLYTALEVPIRPIIASLCPEMYFVPGARRSVRRIPRRAGVGDSGARAPILKERVAPALMVTWAPWSKGRKRVGPHVLSAITIAPGTCTGVRVWGLGSRAQGLGSRA